ncbi:MAG: hypothetical protein P9X22_04750 [Candidatus Zapsychrus exili]|nr:hypothetical protein [Candidatus Zapsychrus exili]
MTITPQTTVSSIEAITSSISTDPHTYRWFYFLIFQPSLKKKLCSKEDINKIYKKLKKTVQIQMTLYIFSMLLLCFAYVSKQYLSLLTLTLFLYPLIKLYLEKKRCVVEISNHMLSRDFDTSEIITKTLYQITSIYGKKYKIPCLVETIHFSDNLCRKAIIFTFIITCFIYPFDRFWKIIFFVLFVYSLIYLVTNTHLAYKCIKPKF